MNPHEGHEQFEGMVCIPNLSGADDQHPVGLKFRNLGEGKKYLQPSGQVARLFNLNALRVAKDTIYVTEGEFDAIILNQAGLPAIGVPGATNWGGSGREYRMRMFDGLRVVLIVDNDDAGKQLAHAMRDLPDLELRSPAPWKDANDYWLGCGQDVDKLRDWAVGSDARHA